MKAAAEAATSHSLIHEIKIKFENRNYEYGLSSTSSDCVCLTQTQQAQNYAAKHRLRTRKILRVISVKHVQHSLMMDHKRSETRRS